MAISIIQRQTGSQGATSSFALAFGSAVTAGDALIALVALGSSSASVTSMSDTWGNTWAKAVSAQAQSRDAEIWYALNATAGATTVTVNLSASTAVALNLIEASWIFTSAALDRIANSSGSSKSPVTGTTATTAQANELAIGFATTGSLNAPNSGPTNSFTALTNITTNVSLFGAYQAESATGAFSTGWTLGNVTGWNGVIATFKAVSGAVAGTSSETAASGWSAAGAISVLLSQLDAAASGDAAMTAATVAASATDIAQSGDTASTQRSVAASASDSASSGDAATTAASIAAGMTEAAATADGNGVSIQIGAAALEIAATADSTTNGAAINVQASEAAGTPDAASASVAFAALTGDAAAADDVCSAAAFIAGVADASVASELPLGSVSATTLVVDAVGTVDSSVFAVAAGVVATADSANAVELVSAAARGLGGAGENTIAKDAPAASAQLAALALEIAAATDAPAAGIGGGAVSSEQAYAEDLSSAVASSSTHGFALGTTARAMAPMLCAMRGVLPPLQARLTGSTSPVELMAAAAVSSINCEFDDALQPLAVRPGQTLAMR